jgi:DMSO/TMAO reductase YedYZ molybdopterin-dependent catalytic subunit
MKVVVEGDGKMNAELPKGQRARSDFPRFGLTHFANRFPRHPDQARLQVSGDVVSATALSAPLEGMPRVEQVSDFHCVTTWSSHALRWGGVRFADFYDLQIAPLLATGAKVKTVVLRGQDGYRTTLPFEDLMAADVLLADSLDGLPLSIAHGAPLRLVAPAHYGYKSMKHLSRIEFWQSAPSVRPAAFAFMDHPRARVAFEERGRWLPGWLLRLVYRLTVRPTAARFANAMAAYGKRDRKGA